MFVSTGVSPVISLRDYVLSVTPQDGYLKIDGEYHISSNLNIPDNLIELQHRLPSQLIDKIFLKATGRSCNSSEVNLKCLIYKSSSFIDIKNDRSLSYEGKDFPSLTLETKFSMNKQVNHNLLHHHSYWSSDLNSLKHQISKNSFETILPLKNYYFLNDLNLNKSSGHFMLDLVKSLIIKSNGNKEYKYQKVGFYISKRSEILAGSPILSAWEIPEKEFSGSQLRIKTLGGRILLKDPLRKRYKNIDLKTLKWRVNKNKDSLSELVREDKLLEFETISNFPNGEIDITLSISKDDWTNIIQLKSSLKGTENAFHQVENLLSIDPYDPLLKNLSLDHTWIVEKM